MNYMTETNTIAADMKKTKARTPRAVAPLRPITARQKMVLIYMKAFLSANDELPTMAAISARFGYKSQNSAQDHVTALLKKGFLDRNEIGSLRIARGKAGTA